MSELQPCNYAQTGKISSLLMLAQALYDWQATGEATRNIGIDDD